MGSIYLNFKLFKPSECILEFSIGFLWLFLNNEICVGLDKWMRLISSLIFLSCFRFSCASCLFILSLRFRIECL
ncbi:unnamed protein product [Moneuplotes crassus]|uniref:Uncharacterized protein n=1 Tax=Euplotes crassus TaxID=5936 RepID=A0AAD1XL32_EUPCR|nr:unnamed protein product [Moneuplotes crassus]